VVIDHATTAEIHGGVYGLPVNFRIGRDRSIARKYPGAFDPPVAGGKIDLELGDGE